MFKSFTFITLLTLSFTAAAQSPVPRVGKHCPAFTSKSGDYCVPNAKSDGSTDSYIVKSGNRCPYGYFKDGDYCRKGVGDEPESIPREPGADCPYKWYKSGNYCWKGAGAD